MISDGVFNNIRQFIYDQAGIKLSEEKRALVVGRLAKRLRSLDIEGFDEYWTYLNKSNDRKELQHLVDVLTTNETRFFREPRHFHLLQEIAKNTPTSKSLRVWCGASSTGQEPYSIGMVLSTYLRSSWQMIASDINLTVLAKAKSALYMMEMADQIPDEFRYRYLLQGVRRQEGNFLVDGKIRQNIDFVKVNLIHDTPDIGRFDIIFLRNVLIYFDRKTIELVVNKMVSYLNDGGYLFIGHSENIRGINSQLELVEPTVYRKSRHGR